MVTLVENSARAYEAVQTALELPAIKDLGFAFKEISNGASLLEEVGGTRHKGLTKKVVVTIPSEIASGISELREVIQVSSVGLNALKFTGAAGEAIVLAFDAHQLYKRGSALHKTKKERGQAKKDSYAEWFLTAQQNYLRKLVASSTIAVTTDGVATAVSAGAPIISLPVNVLSFLVSVGRLTGEKQANKAFKAELQKIVKEYEEAPQGTQSDKDKHLALKQRYEEAKEAKEQIEKIYKTGIRDGLFTGKELAQSQAEADKALQELEAEYQESQIEFDFYMKAKELIIHLDPLLVKEKHLEQRIEAYEAHYESTYGEKIVNSYSAEKQFKEELQQKLHGAELEYSKRSSELSDLLHNIHCAESAIDMYYDTISENQKEIEKIEDNIRFEGFRMKWHDACIDLNREIGQLKEEIGKTKGVLQCLKGKVFFRELDKTESQENIVQIKKEISAFDAYKKDRFELFKVREKIKDKIIKKKQKLRAQSKLPPQTRGSASILIPISSRHELDPLDEIDPEDVDEAENESDLFENQVIEELAKTPSTTKKPMSPLSAQEPMESLPIDLSAQTSNPFLPSSMRPVSEAETEIEEEPVAKPEEMTALPQPIHQRYRSTDSDVFSLAGYDSEAELPAFIHDSDIESEAEIEDRREEISVFT